MEMRAQISPEFLVVYAALLLVFVVVFAIFFGGSVVLFQSQDSAAAARSAQSLAAAMNFVYLAGDGASYSFTPAGRSGDENLTVSDYAVTSGRPHASASAPLLDAAVNASEAPRDDFLISNQGGDIRVG